MASTPFLTLENSRVSISSIFSSMPLHVIFLAFLLLLLPLPFISGSPSISYTDLCGAVAPKSAPSAAYIDSLEAFKLFNGFFFGGSDGFFSREDHQSSSFSGSSFFFFPRSINRTQNPNILQISGGAIFRYGWLGAIHGRNLYQIAAGPLHRVRPRLPRAVPQGGHASFDLSGYWSQETGNLCMVGSGHGRSVEGKALELSAVLRLNYPNVSDIKSSLVSGTLEIYDATNSSNQFKPIHVVAYSRKSYQYTQISEAEESFAKFADVEESLGFQSDLLCSQLKLLSRANFKLDYQKNCSLGFCSPPTHSIGFTPNYMTLNQIECSDDGKIHMYIGFSNLSYYGLSQILNPSRSLVAEGIWDKKKNRLSLVACHILDSPAGSLANMSVDDCTVRINLWLPAVWSIHSRSSIIGRIWSTHQAKANSYFDMISFWDSGAGAYVHKSSLIKYKYTLVEEARKYCPQGRSGNAGRRYPDASSLSGRRFAISSRGEIGRTTWGYLNPVSIGEKVYSYSPVMVALGEVPSLPTEVSKESVMNVSYQISFSYKSTFSGANSEQSFSAEGLYDAQKGSLCMVGCRVIDSLIFTNHTKPNDSLDCRIFVNVQLASVIPEAGDHLLGRIRSTRDKNDPLYFKPLEFTSNTIYKEQAVTAMWRMDAEIIMVLISLTLSCVFIILQLFHVNKNPEILPTISLAMLIILFLSQMIPLVLNFDALFTMNNRKNVFLQSGGWLEVNEVIVRLIMMINLLLQLRLLQVCWTARSADDSKKGFWVAEKKTLKMCMPIYFAGGLIAWFLSKKIATFSGEVVSYAGLILDGFLLPQVIFNIFSESKGKALALSFYLGNTVVRALPHFYDVYRSQHYLSSFKSSFIYASPNDDFYSLVFDIAIPCGGLLLSMLIYLQQRFGGTCLVSFKSCWSKGYATIRVTSS